MTITGTSGKDNLSGTTGADEFDMSQGGNDTVFGDLGDDTFNFGSKLTENDKIDGGGGTDTLAVDGDYSAPMVFKAHTIENIESMFVTFGHDYNFTILDSNTTGTFTFNAQSLGIADGATFDASADTDTTLSFLDGAGNDVFIGGDMHTSFALDRGGNDEATGGDAGDYVFMGSKFAAGDKLDGKDGTDFVSLFGDYSAGLTVTGTMLKHMEVVQISGDFQYNFTLQDGVIAAGAGLVCDASFLTAGHGITIDDRGELDGLIFCSGGAGDDVFKAGHGDDVLQIRNGGTDIAKGNGGNDEFVVDGTFDPFDQLDGGPGSLDEIEINGDLSGGLVFLATTVKNVELITANPGSAADLTIDEATVGAGKTLTVDATLLAAGESMDFDASADSDGLFVMMGGLGNDHFIGGDGADVLRGGGGADDLTGGIGGDSFAYLLVTDSTSTVRDEIIDFNALQDFIDMPFTVSDVDTKVATGTLSSGSFDNDLETAINPAKLTAFHAVLFTPNAGTFAGRIFAIVDANGSAGYQNDADYVIEVTGITHMSQFDEDNFI